MRLALSVAVVCVLAQPAFADSADDVQASAFDPSTCNRKEPSSLASALTAPVTWSDYEVAGTFLEPRETVRALLAPTMNRHRALTEDARNDIRASAAAFGYHVVGIGTRDTTAGTHAVLHLAPLPRVRSIDIDMDQSILEPVLEDDVQRRLRLRVGSYLPWTPKERACDLHEEIARVESFLFDRGYFDAKAKIVQERHGEGVKLDVDVNLGAQYEVDVARIRIVGANLAVSEARIKDKFRPKPKCVFEFVGGVLCYGREGFSVEQHEEDKQEVVKLFNNLGYPAARVITDYNRARSPDRRTRTVRFRVTIDQGQRLDVVFEGYEPGSVTVEAMREQLTFDQAKSIDDFEATESAAALTRYFQSRGYFDARVTWHRERFDVFDRMIFRIEQGARRPVKKVEFIGATALSRDTLLSITGTDPVETKIFGTNRAATTAQLAADVDAIASAYRKAGYRDARVSVTAATEERALDDAALAAAMLLADRGDGLYVRFRIDEGPPTLLARIHVELGDSGDAITTPEDRALCEKVLGYLADLHGDKAFAAQADRGRCVATAPAHIYREEDAAVTAGALRERLFNDARPRVTLAYEVAPMGTRRVAATYRLANLQQLTFGNVVVRGNFRTHDSVIYGQLGLRRGQPLTRNAIANSARTLRSTALFDAVTITMPDLATTSAGEVHAVVEVTERHDRWAEVQVEAGLSTYNGLFGRLVGSRKNMFGRGVSLDLGVTYGFDFEALFERSELEQRQLAFDGTFALPQFLTRRLKPVDFRTELTGFHRNQDTARFGLLTTSGVTLALANTQSEPLFWDLPGRMTFGLQYDFRRRNRNVNALRPIGADEDDRQVAIQTDTGSVGLAFGWEARTDRNGALSPLAAEAGFRLDARVTFASRALLGDQDFFKVSAAGSKFWPIGANLVLRADLRYDQGFPLGDAALLPEVERFFAGGDATVRGYEDDRLATEIVQVGVPPLDNVDQIRVLPAGGNIRLLGSLDAQVRIYGILSSALFVDAGLIKNQWSTVELEDVRPSAGLALVRFVTPFGIGAVEYAIPLQPRLGDDPRGRWHVSFAARAQF